jgi:uncharacterized protein YukE
MTGFEVVPESLEDMATSFSDAETAMIDLKRDVESWTMDSLAYGLLGEIANYPHIYDTTLGEISTELDKFVTSFGDAADALKKTAKAYAELDGSWYEKYGYDA